MHSLEKQTKKQRTESTDGVDLTWSLASVESSGSIHRNGTENIAHETFYQDNHELTHSNTRTNIEHYSFSTYSTTLSPPCNFKPLAEIGQFSIHSFFPISRQITTSLIELHTAGIMHLNLTTDTILVGPGLKSAKLQNANILKRSGGSDIRFIAPEQTGRMNKSVDFRSDLYSLGVIFFFMLSGRLPLESDTVESDSVSSIMKYHISSTKTCLKLKYTNSSIPTPLCMLVGKLMEKDISKRYQCAKGLLYDLVLVSSLLYMDFVSLGRFDCSDKFRIPQELYGREEEFQTLSAVWDTVKNKGSFEFVLVEGEVGVGKSHLVMELTESVFLTGGFMIRGKYDQAKAVEPFSAILEALRSLFSLILMEDATTINQYKHMILSAIGEESRVLIDILPTLRLIIGEVQQVADVILKDLKNRFNHLLCSLIKSICTPEHPIVFVVDDLQWADTESLEILAILTSDPSFMNLLLVGIYRQDDKGSSDAIQVFLDVVENNKASTKIKLDCLNPNDINEMVSDTLQVSTLDSRTVSIFIHDKTKGNPLFTTLLFRELVNDQMIFYNDDKGSWEWNLEQYDQMYDDEDIDSFMKKKILKLDVDSRNVLKVASCYGHRFLLSSLIHVAGEANILRPISEGFILSDTTDSNWYYFAHDSIQSASLSLIPEDIKIPILYNIAKVLTTNSTNEELDEILFTILDLFNTVSSSVDSQELAVVAIINLKAAKKAKASAAFKTAMKYLAFGISLLQESSWVENYDLCLELYQNATEAAYFLGYIQFMEKCVEQILEHAACTLHKIPSYSVLIWAMNDKGMFGKANTLALKAFDELGEKLPKKLTCEPRKVANAFDLDKLKLASDDKISAVMQLGSDIIYSSYHLEGNSYESIAYWIVKLSLKYGVTNYSSCGLAAFAAVLCNSHKYIKEGCDIAEVAFQIQKKEGTKYLYNFVTFILHYLVIHWRKHVHQALDPLILSYQVALEVGANDRAFATFDTFCQLSFLSGRQLTILEKNLEFCDARLNVKSKSSKSAYQSVLNLLGKGNPNPAYLFGTSFDISILDSDECCDYCEVAKSSLHGAILAYYFHEFGRAAELIKKCREYKSYLKSSYFLVIYTLYEGLIALSMAKESIWNYSWKTVANESIDRFKEWSVVCPENYQNKLSLLEAEMAAFTGQDYKAKYFYNMAVESSNVSNFTHEEALACERFGIFCIDSRNQEIGIHYLTRAVRCFSYWGAKTKVDHLINLHPEIERDKKYVPFELEVNSDCVTAVSDFTNNSGISSGSDKKVLEQITSTSENLT